MTCYPRLELSWPGDPRQQRKKSLNATEKLDGICTSKTGIIFDDRTDGHTLGKYNASPLACGGVLILHIRDAFYCGCDVVYIISSLPFFNKISFKSLIVASE